MWLVAFVVVVAAVLVWAKLAPVRVNTIELPNKLRVAGFTELDTIVVYHEIFTQETYFKHGVTLADNATVLDAGANIGLFSVWLSRRFANLTLHAFEPVPPIADALERNFATHVVPRTRAPSAVHAVGLSDRTQTPTFAFDPDMSFASSMYREQIEGIFKRESLRRWTAAILKDQVRLCTDRRSVKARVLSAALAALDVPVLSYVVMAAFAARVGLGLVYRWFATRHYACKIVRTGDWLREQRIGRVDLFKIDVEGCEFDILRGIDDAQWPQLRQFVIEVHDVDDRLAKMQQFLRSKGYRVTAEQEDWEVHDLLRISTIYAVRNDDDYAK